MHIRQVLASRAPTAFILFLSTALVPHLGTKTLTLCSHFIPMATYQWQHKQKIFHVRKYDLIDILPDQTFI